MAKSSPRSGGGRALLRQFALSFPGAHEDFPWGESVIKVGKKVFVFLGRSPGPLSLSVKLPESNLLALDLPFASPTGYGLARGGWVTATFEPGDHPPLDLLRRWIEESYRAVAPRRLVAELEAETASSTPARRTSRPKASARRPARAKASARRSG